jgi:hypothetical protein
MKFRTTVTCSKCQQPIVPGAGFGFVCFKIPGKEGYLFFHRRFRSGDCWETYMRRGDKSKTDTKGQGRVRICTTSKKERYGEIANETDAE